MSKIPIKGTSCTFGGTNRDNKYLCDHYNDCEYDECNEDCDSCEKRCCYCNAECSTCNLECDNRKEPFSG